MYVWTANSLPVPAWNTHSWAVPTLNRTLVADSHTIHAYRMGTSMKLVPKGVDIMAASYNRLPSTSQAVGEDTSCHILMLCKFLNAMRYHGFLIAKITIFPCNDYQLF